MLKVQHRKLQSWYTKILSLAILITISFFIGSCEENPLEISQENVSLVTDTLYANFDTTHAFNARLSTLSAERLLIGSFNGFTSRVVMRFVGFPSDTIAIDSAWIQFTMRERIGEMFSDFTIRGYSIRNFWLTDTANVWSDYQSNVDFSRSLGEMIIPGDTTGVNDSLVFIFNQEGLTTLNNWVDTVSSGIENNGLALDFAQANFIQELQARNTSVNPSIGPYLIYTYTVSTDSGIVQVTDSLLTNSDAFLVKSNFQPIQNRNHTVTLSPRATVLDFNIDTLNQKYPKGIVVESANLQLFIDSQNTKYNKGAGPDMRILPLTSPLKSTNVKVDSTLRSPDSRNADLVRFGNGKSYVEVLGGRDRQILAQNYIQRKLNNPSVFKGLYVEFKTLDDYLAYFSFFRYNGDRDKRPRLIIQSLKLPRERL